MIKDWIKLIKILVNSDLEVFDIYINNLNIDVSFVNKEDKKIQFMSLTAETYHCSVRDDIEQSIVSYVFSYKQLKQFIDEQIL